ncbi:MAG: hypothetical protein GYA68_04980 [Syntrophorhabdus sp.]|nr:hypothetical protein [Syntrophorhabdus sp.]HNY70668.1 hypothetical protein [Syntrophorhabdus sp.]
MTRQTSPGKAGFFPSVTHFKPAWTAHQKITNALEGGMDLRIKDGNLTASDILPGFWQWEKRWAYRAKSLPEKSIKEIISLREDEK